MLSIFNGCAKRFNFAGWGVDTDSVPKKSFIQDRSEIMSLKNRLCLVVACATLAWCTGCCTGPFACSGGACSGGACPGGDCPGGACSQVGCVDGACGHVGATCGGCGDCNGCGELYIDPWINHPADCCDPCDQCGNFNGQSCGKCRSIFFGAVSLWGYRYGDSGCDGCGHGGCDGGCLPVDRCDGACGDGCDSCCGSGLAVESEIYEGDGQVIQMVEPAPSQQIVEVYPQDSHYIPHRTKRIFRARPDVASGEPGSIEY